MSNLCQGCGAELPPKTWTGPNQKWCSRRCRQAQYGGVCQECGGLTDGSQGRAKAPTICRGCTSWTPEAVILAFQEWAETHDGKAPRTADATPGAAGHGKLPSSNTVVRHFGSWNVALSAAGLKVNLDRSQETTDEMEAAVRMGETLREVAARYGCTPENVHMRLKTRGVSVREIRSASVRS